MTLDAQHTSHLRSLARLGALFASAAALAMALPGCGGGGGSEAPASPPIGGGTPPPPPPPPPPATVAIGGVVSDGPLQGATACYDLNDNSACDAAEPTSAATDANGNYTVSVQATDAGQHAVVVTVPASAIDQTTGAAIGVALTFKAPATNTPGAQSVFVSPLTTLVVSQMQATGASAAVAAAVVQAQAGLTLSPLFDFSGPSPAAQQSALLARLVVQTHKALAAAMAPRLGQLDVSGATVTQADIDKAVANALRAALPALAATVADPAVSGATDVQAALVAAAQELVATQPALNAAEALAAVGAAKLPEVQAAAVPTDTVALRALSYTDANNWSYRALAGNTADNTPDASGLVRFYDIHRQAIAGVVTSWGFGTLEARKGDRHWTGSAWAECTLGQRSSTTPRDAQGRSVFDYCDGYERGVSLRTGIDIAGQTLASVITDKIRTYPGEDSGTAYADWGPSNLGRLGSTTFPAGSQLYYQTTTPTETAFGYDVTGAVGTWGTSISAGGDARNNQTLPCYAAYIDSLNVDVVGVATFEQLVTVNPGTPCTVDPQTTSAGSSLNPNIWWSGTSLSLGNVVDGTTRPAGTGNFFTTTANLRVAFTGAGNAATYYRCYVRTATGGTRNCVAIGTGTYSVQTLGDARVMTFNNLPALAQRLSVNRVFVERGGLVYSGYRSVPNITRSTIRLNLAAANALFGILGIAPIAP